MLLTAPDKGVPCLPAQPQASQCRLLRASSSSCRRPGHQPKLTPHAVLSTSGSSGGEGFAPAFRVPVGHAAAEWEAAQAAAQAASMAEYGELKAQLLRRTRRGGAFLALYLFLGSSAEMAACSLVGAAASYAYFSWLARDVDQLQTSAQVPLVQAQSRSSPLERAVWTAAAVFRQALRPRLLVPAGLGLALAAYDAVAPAPMPLEQKGALLCGFFSYKGSLLLSLWDALRPRKFAAADEERPVLPNLPDVPYLLNSSSRQEEQAAAARARAAAEAESRRRGRKEEEDDGVSLTAEVAGLVDKILARESRSVLKGLPQK